MVYKYLNDQKLRYFWSKIKALLADKSDKGHTHGTTEITGGMDGNLAGYNSEGKLTSINVNGNVVESALAGYNVAYGIQEQLDDKANTIHSHDYLPRSGGTLTGNLIGKYLTGTWLQTTSNTHLNSTASKIAVLDGSGWIYHRTPNEILSDIGGAPLNHTHEGGNIDVTNLLNREDFLTATWRQSVFDYNSSYKGRKCIKVNQQTLTSKGGNNIFSRLKFESGQYALTVKWADGNEHTNIGNMRLRFHYTDGTNSAIACGNKEWNTQTLVSDKNKTVASIGTYYGSKDTNTYIANIKLEKGDKFTGWTDEFEFGQQDNDTKQYRNEALSNMASYVMREYKSSCVTGYTGDTVVYKYDTNKGYMGLFGRYLDFVYTDKVENKNVVYMDCAVFASLIFKCRSYTDSPYHYAFTTTSPMKEELYHRSLENYGMDKPWTFDFLNNLNTGRMIYQAYKAGLEIYHISERKGLNSTANYFDDNIDKLQSGDVIFRGVSNAINETNKGQIFDGVDHTGIFVKDLSELNTASGVPSGVTFKEVTGQYSSRGYIVEFSGSLDSTGYKDCLRITAFEKWAEYKKGEIDWTQVYAVKPVSNHMTSNKAHVQATGILKCYDFDVRVLQEMNGYYYKPCEIIHRIASGWILKDNEDLNDYVYDGLYQCNLVAVAKTLKNNPVTDTNFDLKSIGFRDGAYGTQIILCNSNKDSIIYTRTCFTKGNWSPWKRIATTDNEITTTTWTRLTTSANFIVDGTKPWINHIRRQGNVVTMNGDLTLKYQLNNTREYLCFYSIPDTFKPPYLFKDIVYTEQKKRLFIELKPNGSNGLSIMLIPIDVISAGDRIRFTKTYMI